MYQQLYAEVASGSTKHARLKEREALEIAIRKLSVAKERGALSRESFEATDYLRRLWTIFIADLTDRENGLPDNLRASLISIGIWVKREADLIDRGASANFDGLIDINQLIADGLV